MAKIKKDYQCNKYMSGSGAECEDDSPKKPKQVEKGPRKKKRKFVVKKMFGPMMTDNTSGD